MATPSTRRSTSRLALLALALLCTPVATPAAAAEPEPQDQWPQWRGPLGTGAAPRGNPPLVWAEDRNVRWKSAIPGMGLSSPIVWGDRVFLTTAVPVGAAVASVSTDAPGAHDNIPPSRELEFVVLALDRRDGRLAWQRTVRRERPHESTHFTGSWASASAVTDGEHLIASFGSRGIYAMDLDGKPLWEKDLGRMRTLHAHGEGSSPALWGNTLVVNWDHEGESFLIALDKRTGAELWRVERDEVTSWSTPLIVEENGKPQAIVSATGRVRGYDLATGEVLWECGGLSRNVVASPVAGNGLVYVASSYDTRAMVAIRLAGARGDLTGTRAVAWTRERDTPYVPSPLLAGGMLFFVKHLQGFLTGVDAKTGETLFGPQRLPGVRSVFASPVEAAGRVYVVGREGTTLVLRRGAQFELLAQNRLDERFSASPAIAGEELYLRGERHLYCLAEEGPAVAAPRYDEQNSTGGEE